MEAAFQISDGVARWLWGPAYTAHCLEVAIDPLRAMVWVAVNLSVAFAYFGIPREIRHWSRALNVGMSNIVARLFRAFIIYCGVSHMAMILIMPTAPWPIILPFFVPLSLVSILTYVVVRLGRRRIVGSLENIRKLAAQ